MLPVLPTDGGAVSWIFDSFKQAMLLVGGEHWTLIRVLLRPVLCLPTLALRLLRTLIILSTQCQNCVK